jgi:hypothetical protein
VDALFSIELQIDFVPLIEWFPEFAQFPSVSKQVQIRETILPMERKKFNSTVFQSF